MMSEPKPYVTHYQERTMKTPLIIAIEGPDKVGKATQTQLLSSRLWSEGLTTLTVEVPIFDNLFYPQIYAMLADGTAKTFPGVFQALQAANRLKWQRESVVSLARYDVLLFDRWNLSSWVYGRASGLSEDLLATLLSGMLEPDCTIILDGTAMAQAEDVYEADSEFRTVVRKLYRAWAEEHNVPILDANRPINVVQQDIWSEVSKHVTDAGRS